VIDECFRVLRRTGGNPGAGRFVLQMRPPLTFIARAIGGTSEPDVPRALTTALLGDSDSKGGGLRAGPGFWGPFAAENPLHGPGLDGERAKSRRLHRPAAQVFSDRAAPGQQHAGRRPNAGLSRRPAPRANRLRSRLRAGGSSKPAGPAQTFDASAAATAGVARPSLSPRATTAQQDAEAVMQTRPSGRFGAGFGGAKPLRALAPGWNPLALPPPRASGRSSLGKKPPLQAYVRPKPTGPGPRGRPGAGPRKLPTGCCAIEGERDWHALKSSGKTAGRGAEQIERRPLRANCLSARQLPLTGLAGDGGQARKQSPCLETCLAWSEGGSQGTRAGPQPRVETSRFKPRCFVNGGRWQASAKKRLPRPLQGAQSSKTSGFWNQGKKNPAANRLSGLAGKVGAAAIKRERRGLHPGSARLIQRGREEIRSRSAGICWVRWPLAMAHRHSPGPPGRPRCKDPPGFGWDLAMASSSNSSRGRAVRGGGMMKSVQANLVGGDQKRAGHSTALVDH